MKIIALDVGSKRIGMAKADSNVRVAIPAGTVEVDGTELQQIISFARVYGTHLFVIGLPRNNQGQETAQSAYVRNFTSRLKTVMPEAKIRFQDESFTSVEAEERLKSRKHRYEKGEIDAEAAAIILQDFLESFSSNSDNDSSRTNKKADKRNSSKKSHILRNSLLSLAAVIILAGIAGFIYYRINLLPVAVDIDCASEAEELPKECNEITFTVKDGESAQQIGNNLANAGLIRSAIIFNLQYHLAHKDENLQTGDYRLKPTLSTDEIIGQLIRGSNDNVFTFTIIPGETLRSIKQKLIDQGYSSEDVESAFTAAATPTSIGEDGTPVYEKYPVLAGKPADASLEGYIFGDTYEFYKNESLEKIIGTTLEAMDKVVADNNLIEGYQVHGLSLYQGITLASIVQKEATGADQATVAQVFYSRLAADMMLGSDVTAQYAADLVDPDRQTYTDNSAVLQIDSPYNTRLYHGLPYGPICNPGAEALIAAASPTDTDYLFFLTGDDGVVYYSHTDSEHQQNISEHCQELCKTSL
ncbi:endolytic transglycosylase MltG [Candidatus Saccharibacteria bacterium]|nr:endolytic transglycosylase MltG [Candidatus Saccharibacteria bacterium]